MHHYYEDRHLRYPAHETTLEWPTTWEEHRRSAHLIPHHVVEEDWPVANKESENNEEDSIHDADFFKTDDYKHPDGDDFSEWHSYYGHKKWYEIDHDKALRHREKQLFGRHYDVHEEAAHPAWFYDKEGELHQHSEGPMNKHYESLHRDGHFDMTWPTVHHDDDEFYGQFSHELARDHDIIQFHKTADADFDSDDDHTDFELDAWYRQYEDPHMHAPLTHHHAHSLIDEDEPSPDEKDFYAFDWDTLHSRQHREAHKETHETHFEPMEHHGDSHHKKDSKKKSEKTQQPK